MHGLLAPIQGITNLIEGLIIVHCVRMLVLVLVCEGGCACVCVCAREMEGRGD